MAKIIRKPRVDTVIFYLLLLLLIGGFLYVASAAMVKLEDYLARYQQSHINTQYPLVFEELFGDPDWADLYDRAGMKDTDFEGKESFVAYMEEKVGDRELTCFIESNGTHGKKCPVYLGDEEIGVFYMTSPQEDAADTGLTSIEIIDSFANSLKLQNWSLERVEIYAPLRNQQVTLCSQYDTTVLLNGKPLGREFVVQNVSTLAESYLPEGIHGPRQVTYRVGGFLVAPEVSMLDANGNPVEFYYDQERGMYFEVLPVPPTIPQDRRDFLVDATKAYCKYMIRADLSYSFTKYFDHNSDTYYYITHSDTWMQLYHSYRFGEPEISEYYSYSDELYTARLKLSLFVLRENGTTKEYPIDSTYFVELQDGKWKITNIINLSIQQEFTSVRLDFMQNGESLGQMFVDSKVRQFNAPAVTPPEGKVFAGWFRETVDQNGDTVLSLVFKPDSTTGMIYLPEGTVLEPMVLQAHFE